MIEGIEIYEGKKFKDDRGWFMESWCADAIHHDFCQDNTSFSKFGTLRGMHFQKEPFAQGKLVSVLVGSVFDVAVDVRKGSDTFGQWFGIELSSENNQRMYVPEGFAHGFLVTSIEGALFHYKCTEFWNSESEDSIVWNDPAIGIDWPITPIFISDKDKKAKTLDLI